MMAPTGARCKGAVAPESARDQLSAIPEQPKKRRHGIVSGIIIPPNFCQAPALLNCEKRGLRWPDPFGSGFLSPQPPGAVGIGPVRRKAHRHCGPTRVGPFSFGVIR